MPSFLCFFKKVFKNPVTFFEKCVIINIYRYYAFMKK